MNSKFQERIVAILQESPNGLTSNQIAERPRHHSGEYKLTFKQACWPMGSSAKAALAVAQGGRALGRLRKALPWIEGGAIQG